MNRASVILGDAPDWSIRSVLTIAPGRWEMRSGHTALVTHQKILKYGDKQDKSFPIWVGHCIDCNAPLTWNINGTFAAVGKHANDIVGPA